MAGEAHGGRDMGGMDMGQEAHGSRNMGGMDMGGMDMGREAHGGPDMSGMDMGGMDMGGMEMPAGLPMAERREDRDGLKLDQLHVPLGPVLPDWPAGLVVRLTLQGDVVQHAEAQALGPGGRGSFWDEPWHRAAAGEPVTTGEAARRRAAAHRGRRGRLLAVAGWDDAATMARRLRDETLAGTPPARLRPAIHRFARRVARSRTLAWLTRDLGVLMPEDAAAGGVRGPASRAAGDVTARYRRWCSDLCDVAAVLDDGAPLGAAGLEPPRGPLEPAGGAVAVLLAAMPRLLAGAELAAVRLTIASLDPDLDELAVRAEVAHGR
jgi:hypothetical protein